MNNFTNMNNEKSILAVGSLAQEPVVDNGELTVGWRMKVTMSCDHRVIDGAQAVRFTTYLCKVLGDVEALLRAS